VGEIQMTTLLEQAFAETKKLPQTAQDKIAEYLLALLELKDFIEITQEKDVIQLLDDELMWDMQFSKSGDLLEKMANEALADYLNGETELLNPDEL
jgi:hypothetical protein